jgi:hypothetical protein
MNSLKSLPIQEVRFTTTASCSSFVDGFIIKLTKLPIRVARFFLGATNQNLKNKQSWHKIYQMAVNLTKWPYNISTSSITRPFKIYPNGDFWFKMFWHLATLLPISSQLGK